MRRPSFLCLVLRVLLRLILKPLFASEAGFQGSMRRLRRLPPAKPPADAVDFLRGELPCRAFLLPRPPPAPGQAAPGCTVLYLHGGAYCFNASKVHYLFASFLQRSLGAAIIFPLYPLAPEATGDDALNAVERCYAAACALGGPVCIVGDSAGGGLALALAQRLCCSSSAATAASSQFPARPAALALITPWLDATLDNPGIPAAERLDPWLARAGLRAAARMYSGPGGDPAWPTASPGRGPIAGLPPTSVWVAAHDTLEPDCGALRRRWAAAAGATSGGASSSSNSSSAGVRQEEDAPPPPPRLRYFEAPGGAFHAFPLFRALWLPEGVEAGEQMVAALAEDVRSFRRAAAAAGGGGGW